MAKSLNENVVSNVRELIARITHYEVDTKEFNSAEKCVLTTLKKADTMYFLNTKDIKRDVCSMAEKFVFHGFFKHAEYLKQIQDKYIDKKLSESDLTPRLNIVKFLLCMSKTPTTQFWKHPDKFNFIQDSKDHEEVIDWGAYLNEGIERWSPVKEDSFEDYTDSEDEADTVFEESTHQEHRIPHPVITESKEIEEYNFRESRIKLTDSIQNGWYSGEVVCMRPPSDWFDARVGILWEQHLQDQVQDLIQIEPVTVISEYKVMREVLWQMWGIHNSTVFEVLINRLVPKANVTVASVCAITFEDFMQVFLPYIEVLDELRQFCKSLESANVPETYRSYGYALQKIIHPVVGKLVEIEEEVRIQETTMTLLNLAEKLENIFQPLFILKKIHQETVIDFASYSSLECSITLLTRLRKSLQFSLNKLEQDIRLTLYLESIYYYFTMVDAWLVKNDLFDYTEEFIISNKNEKDVKTSENYSMNFFLQEGITEFYENDGIIKLICDQVLQIGRNIHLLRLLGKYDVFTKGSETIHQEFVRLFLKELSAFYGCEISETVVTSPKLEKMESYFNLNEMGEWTDFVDLSDGFLTKAFDCFYLEQVEESNTELSLFEKIQATTASLFPLQRIPEKIFSEILKDRFTISGLLVKNLLIENYNLDKQFVFLNHIFLFWDDMIFPFYRRLFEKMNTENSNWGNSVWLTSHLHDIIMDLYPNFYEHCTVQINDFWKECRDSLEACTLLSLQYEIKWPLNIIITKEHIVIYKEIFEFILKMKWALYTINHLSLIDLEPKKKEKAKCGSKTTTQKLKYLRFNLINILNTVQHYVFGFVFNKHRIQFELDFEKSNDLKSLITSHDDFIKPIHHALTTIRDKTNNHHGFNTLLKCVKMLKVMWNQLQYATPENLENCHTTYKLSLDVVNTIVNPVYIYNY